MSKSSIKQFFIWFRNGVCFATTWLLIILLAMSYIYGIEVISAEFLIKMMISIVGGVFLFCVTFLRTIIKKWKFHTRLTVFMILFSLYECVCFYWLGIFTVNGTMLQYGIFVALIMLAYGACMIIYRGYCKKQGMLYTEALKRYQER